MPTAELRRRIASGELAALAGLDVTGLCIDSRRAQPGDVFFALPGSTTDGRLYIDDAVAKGAVAVVTEQPLQQRGAVVIRVADARAALANACRIWFGRDTSKLQLIGVTGTNGKTTLTYLIEAIWRAAGRSIGVIGTIGHRLGSTEWPTGHTTPDPIALCARLQEMERAGADTVVMEVSSHALDQRRAHALQFDVAAFTNLTPDHLDYHGTLDRYFAAKARLFSELLKPSGAAVVNLDGAMGGAMAKQVNAHARLLTVSHSQAAGLRVSVREKGRDFTHLELTSDVGGFSVRTPLVGLHNVENVAVAIGVALESGVAADAIVQALERFVAVPGRLEAVRAGDGRLAFVDYAHTPDALVRVLGALRELPHARLLCVFGCGGDRDSSKRPIMGAAVARHADAAIVTSDNPRSEDPDAIIAAITEGLRAEGRAPVSATSDRALDRAHFAAITDRREAIRFAVRHMRPEDVLLVAGKGHEPYQIIGNTSHHFDDREELRAAFGEQT